VKVILLLTGSIQGTKNYVYEYLDLFKAYSHLWNDDVNEALRKFSSRDPNLEDYEEKLIEFTKIEKEINAV